NRRSTLFSVVALLVAMSSVGTVAQAAGDPVTIQQCFITKPKAFSKNASGTQIVWKNVGEKPLKSVTFAVAYRNAATNYLRRVTDAGSFAPGVQLDHHFDLYNDVTYAGTTTQACHVVSYQFE